ncbi:DUF6468 domain-containing protein [Methylobacterium sp. E-045]|uniref:DUF6468 domain-containing protein n=1 Tax=Methylobacterium sp. E-045 TaxID=2836575 RepID=UPI001FB90FA9|nr:DUF6468 domain-containing protein [Methylobacterium sp. E-045]MCJ2128513.1 DUF6468 domain-containing protein [Methylobacterium sp. E-045]
MSLLVTLAADVLVAVLLVASIVSSVRLSRRITRMKADEAALRQTIGDLVVASSTAERAIIGLRATLDECDRTLADRLGTAERYAADLSAHVRAGETVIARISAIVSHAQPSRMAVVPPVEIRPSEIRAAPVEGGDAPKAAPSSPNGERLGAAAAAALAMSERALGRLRSRAA